MCVATSIRLWHIGDYAYSWEDAGIDRQRFGDFHFLLDESSDQLITKKQRGNCIKAEPWAEAHGYTLPPLPWLNRNR